MAWGLCGRFWGCTGLHGEDLRDGLAMSAMEPLECVWACAHKWVCACECACVHAYAWGENYHHISHIFVISDLVQSLPTTPPTFGPMTKYVVDGAGKWLAQDHTRSKWQSQNSNTGCWSLGQMLIELTVMPFMWLKKNLFFHSTPSSCPPVLTCVQETESALHLLTVQWWT